jgi:hypothetical protein
LSNRSIFVRKTTYSCSVDVQEKPRSREWLIALAVTGLLLIQGWNALFVNSGELHSEIEQRCSTHGLAAFERHDMRLDPGTPPAACLLANIVIALQPGDALDYGSPAWRGNDLQSGTTMSTDADAIALFRTLDLSLSSGWFNLFWPSLLALVMAALVFFWAYAVWGGRAAVLSLAMYVFSLPISSITYRYDLLALTVLLLTASFAALWRFFDLGDVRRVVTTLLAFGLTAVVHPAAWALLPAALVGAMFWTFGRGTEDWQRAGRISRSLLFVMLAAVVLYIGTWAGYGFQRRISPDPTYQPNWSRALPSSDVGLLLRNAALNKELLPQGTIWAASSALMAEPEGESSVGLLTPFLHRSGPLRNALLWLAAIFVFVRGGRSFVAGRAVMGAIAVWIVLAFLLSQGDPAWIWAPVLAPLSVAAGGLIVPNADGKRPSNGWFVLPLLVFVWVYGFPILTL